MHGGNTRLIMASYKLVSKDHIRLDDTRYRHAAHAMVYAPVREKMLGKYEYKYAVMVSAVLLNHIYILSLVVHGECTSV